MTIENSVDKCAFLKDYCNASGFYPSVIEMIRQDSNLDPIAIHCSYSWIRAYLSWSFFEADSVNLFTCTTYNLDKISSVFISDNLDEALRALDLLPKNETFLRLGHHISSCGSIDPKEIILVGRLISVIFNELLSAEKEGYLLNLKGLWEYIDNIILGRNRSKEEFVCDILDNSFSLSDIREKAA